MRHGSLSSLKTLIVPIAFVGFTLTVAFRDIVFRFAFANGMEFAPMAVLTGILGITLSVLFLGRSKANYRVKNKRLLIARLAMNLLSTFLVLKAFELLSPSFIAITTKSALPFLIVAAPMIKDLRGKYSRQEQALAICALLSIGSFSYITLSADVPLFGLIILTVSIVMTLAEFLLLSKSVKEESPFYISAVPSFSLLIVGVATQAFGGHMPLITPTYILLGALAGIMFFLAYYTSLVRYKVLPPGLAEYPSLFTYFLILPMEVFLLNGKFEIFVFANAVIVLLIMTTLFKIHKA